MNMITQLTDYTKESLDVLHLSEIARIIRQDWQKNSKSGQVYFGAKPYIDAMDTLNRIQDNYYADSGKSIVIYFLANAQTWKGPVAKEIKAHLNKLVKACK